MSFFYKFAKPVNAGCSMDMAWFVSDCHYS